MGAIVYYLALPFFYLISILPFRLLYLLSDGIYIILYYVIGYRKAVVLENLRNSFPEKTEKEIKDTCKRYYKYLCDISLETFKTLTISKKAMLKHCSFDEASLALLNKLADENKSIILVLGHLGNWEWSGNTFSILCKHKLYVIYHPLANKHFNGLIIKMRKKYGTGLIPMRETFRTVLSHEYQEELTATAFIADQSPNPEKACWTEFLNQDTPVSQGAELIARKTNYPVVYSSIKKTGRGYYKMFAELLFENPKNASEGEITEAHTKKLEKNIKEQPEVWIWSHRRWKHKRQHKN